MRLRRVIGSDVIVRTATGYQLVGSAITVDAVEFEREVMHALTAGKPNSPERSNSLRTALARWRGTPYLEVGDWPPAVRRRIRLVSLRAQAVEVLADADLDAGTESIADLEANVEEEPLREHRWQQLMVGLYRAGRQADALRSFDRARRMLRDELGLVPGPGLVAAQQAILEHDPALSLPAAGSRTGESKALLDRAIEEGSELMHGGRPEVARDHLLRAADLARDAGDGSRLLRIAIALSGEGWNSGLDPFASNVTLLEEALETAPPGYSPLRAQALARLAVARSFNGGDDVTRRTAERSLDLARLLDDGRTTAIALEANLIVDQDPADLDRRRSWSDELLSLSDAPASCVITAVSARASIDATCGRVDSTISTLASAATDPSMCDHPSSRILSAQAEVLDASRHGDWEAGRAALALAREATERVLVDPTAARFSHRASVGVIAILEGRTGVASSPFATTTFPVTSGEVMLRCGVIRAARSPGEASNLMASMTRDVMRNLRRDVLWLSMWWIFAATVEEWHAEDLAGVAYEILLPFRGLTIVNPGAIYLGSVEHHLGLLATAFGDRSLAQQHFQHALEAHRSAGATEWVRRSEARLSGVRPTHA